MIRIQNNSDTAIIVVHEIYGINQHIKSICQWLSQYGYDIFCPNMLEQKTPFAYPQEQDAYRNFTENVGYTKARAIIERVLADIQDEYEKAILIGFSIGATIAWLCSEESRVNGIVCFYGSRIRDHLEISPQCPALLFFPEVEQSFDVDRVISALATKNNVEVSKYSGQHGFSDPFSPKYNKASAEEAFAKMLSFLHSSKIPSKTSMLYNE